MTNTEIMLAFAILMLCLIAALFAIIAALNVHIIEQITAYLNDE